MTETESAASDPSNTKAPEVSPQGHDQENLVRVPDPSCHDFQLGDSNTCPRCGGHAQILPAGQTRPTNEQSYESCWLLPDGTQPNEPRYRDGGLCSQLRFLNAGLLRELLDALGETGALTPEMLANDANTTLAFLRYARQHPLVSADLVLLLLERLCGFYADAHPNPPKKGRPGVTLHLDLRGYGGARAITTCHQAELQALIADLLDEDLGLFDAFGERIWQVKRVLIDELNTPQGGLELVWPPAAPDAQGGQG